jgi:hypothetical protein
MINNISTLDILEISIYFTYIYTLIYLGVKYQPTPLRSIFLYVYCVITTYAVLRKCKQLKSYVIPYVLAYSLFCVLCYYGIHFTWKEYSSYPLLWGALLISPVMYYISIHTLETIFSCDPYTTIKTFVPIHVFNIYMKYL